MAASLLGTGRASRLYRALRERQLAFSVSAYNYTPKELGVFTVHAETNPRFHALLSAFKRRTGCPVLVNTSFNVRGEPIVCTPEDAFRCFMGTEIDLLVVGNCALRKQDQDKNLAHDYRDEFEPD